MHCSAGSSTFCFDKFISKSTHSESHVHVSVTAGSPFVFLQLKWFYLTFLTIMYIVLLWELDLLLAPPGAEVVFQAPYNPKERQNPPEKTKQCFDSRTKQEHVPCLVSILQFVPTFMSHSMMDTALSGLVSITRSSYIWNKDSIWLRQDEQTFTDYSNWPQRFTFSL